jgi:predicted dehydrogenase
MTLLNNYASEKTKEAEEAFKEVEKDDDQVQEVVTAIVIGAGNRGRSYAEFAKIKPSWMKVIGVAEPDFKKRNLFTKAHDIIPENVFEDWKPLAAKGKIADVVFICTLDHQHYEPVIAFAELKYNIFLEKPMSVSIEECTKITAALEKAGTVCAVGHVLRYSPFHRRIKEILDSKELGNILNIQHVEPVGWYHFAHSYVRGNWHKEKDSTFSLMAKCCHDVDLLRWWTGLSFAKVSSFGSLTWFKKENKPAEAENATRCLDCPIQDTCQFSAKTLYLERRWHTSVFAPSGALADIEDAIKVGPYGHCVYDMDNDVCDNQVVNIEFEKGSHTTPTATLTMISTSDAICQRKVRIWCSNGDIEADEEELAIKVTNFTTRQTRMINPYKGNVAVGGHGGSDMGLMRSLCLAIDAYRRGDMSKSQQYIPPIQEALSSHLFVFAAEHARKKGRVVDVKEYIKENIQ